MSETPIFSFYIKKYTYNNMKHSYNKEGILMPIVKDIISRFGGGILTGDEIHRQVDKGKITITPFDANSINPVSYNVRSGNTVTIYNVRDHFDTDDPSTYADTVTFDLTDKGFMLRPGTLYLVPTLEVIGSDRFEPILTGRSSIGRLGVSIHQQAGFADVGYLGHLTMQFKVTYPTKIYPNRQYAQVYFQTVMGKIRPYAGRYQHSIGAVPSKGIPKQD